MAETSTMAETRGVFQIQPGRGLGWMSLGASVHGIMSRIKSQPQLYPRMKLSYSLEEPVLRPLHIDLPDNGIRLRFDGPDQRLRLIEITAWSHSVFTYKSVEVVRQSVSTDKVSDSSAIAPSTSHFGPSFRHVYNRLFGPAYAGEYIPPAAGQTLGTYVLSYPGLAIRFPLKHSAYSDKADFVSLLSSAALPATSIAVFSGSSWPEARETLFTKPPTLPRSIALAGKNNEAIPDEIDQVIIHGEGKVELKRRSSGPFTVVLSETTPQDLIAELGPPDAIFRKSATRISIHAGDQSGNTASASTAHSAGTDRSSNLSKRNALEDDSELDPSNPSRTNGSGNNTEVFYNYFHHGFDILISHPTDRSLPFPSLEADHSSHDRPTHSEMKLVAVKMFLHGNIPGSYSFNRHRRSRWVIPLPHGHASSTSPSNVASNVNPQALLDFDMEPNDPLPPPAISNKKKKSRSQPPPPPPPTSAQPISVLTSEMRFSQIAEALTSLWSTSTAPESYPLHRYTSKGMVLNRGWSADQDSSPESSVELLGGTMTMDESGIVSAPVKRSNNLDRYSNLHLSNNDSPTSTILASSDAKAGAAAATAAVEKGGGNTQLFGFPGMLFEVLDNGGISCVTIY